MLETAILFAQTVATGALAAWMFTGVRDNILYPSQNEAYTAEVMEMRRIRADFPAAYEPVAHRAITDRRRQLMAFRIVVAVELVACAILTLGAVLMVLALFGIAGADTARSVSIIGTTVFMSVWAGMLTVGNHFSYWFGHEGAQFTHFQMCLWGLGTLILLVIG